MPEKVNITLSIGHGFDWQFAKLGESPTLRADMLSRFWALVNRTDAKGCWPFLGYVASSGYGHFTYRGLRVRAHRLAWLASRGEIPAGLSVLHRCDHPRCVNPSHLFLGTQEANMHDALRKGRKRAWGRQKLNAEQVDEIRRRAAQGEPRATLATAFGVAKNTISGIVNRATWGHLSDASAQEPPSRLPAVSADPACGAPESVPRTGDRDGF